MDALDLKDRKLIFAMEQDARQTNAALAKHIGLTPEAVQYRIERLLKRGVLKFFMGYINFAKLGFVDYGLFITTQRMSRAQEQDFVEFMLQYPYCPYFCKSGGTYDFVVDLLARNPIALMDLVTELTNRFGDFIHQQEIVTRISAHHFPKQYLLDATAAPPPSVYFGGPLDQQVQIDQTDDEILRRLAVNSRAKVVDIAQAVGLSDTAVGTRIRRLEETELITGYLAWAEPQSFGYQSFNLLLKSQNFRSDDELKLFEFCRCHRHVTWLLKTLGRWDFEIGVEVKTQEQLQEVVYQLKDDFAHIIQRMEFAPMFKTIKYTQYPFSPETQVWKK